MEAGNYFKEEPVADVDARLFGPAEIAVLETTESTSGSESGFEIVMVPSPAPYAQVVPPPHAGLRSYPPVDRKSLWAIKKRRKEQYRSFKEAELKQTEASWLHEENKRIQFEFAVEMRKREEHEAQLRLHAQEVQLGAAQDCNRLAMRIKDLESRMVDRTARARAENEKLEKEMKRKDAMIERQVALVDQLSEELEQVKLLESCMQSSSSDSQRLQEELEAATNRMKKLEIEASYCESVEYYHGTLVAAERNLKARLNAIDGAIRAILKDDLNSDQLICPFILAGQLEMAEVQRLSKKKVSYKEFGELEVLLGGRELPKTERTCQDEDLERVLTAFNPVKVDCSDPHNLKRTMRREDPHIARIIADFGERVAQYVYRKFIELQDYGTATRCAVHVPWNRAEDIAMTEAEAVETIYLNMKNLVDPKKVKALASRIEQRSTRSHTRQLLS